MRFDQHAQRRRSCGQQKKYSHTCMHIWIERNAAHSLWYVDLHVDRAVHIISGMSEQAVHVFWNVDGWRIVQYNRAARCLAQILAENLRFWVQTAAELRIASFHGQL